MALEAVRDREIWKKKGAERLREAGFGEGEVRRWEDSTLLQGGGVERERERGVEDVRWKGKGEEREWDVGKVLLVEEENAVGVRKGGEVELEAAWKRKGTARGRGGGLVREMEMFV